MLPGSCCSWGLHALQLRALRASVAVCMPSMHQTLWTPVKMFAQHRAGGTNGCRPQAVTSLSRHDGSMQQRECHSRTLCAKYGRQPCGLFTWQQQLRTSTTRVALSTNPGADAAESASAVQQDAQHSHTSRSGPDAVAQPHAAVYDRWQSILQQQPHLQSFESTGACSTASSSFPLNHNPAQQLQEQASALQLDPLPDHQTTPHPDAAQQQPPAQQQWPPYPEEVLLIGVDPDTNGAIAVIHSQLHWTTTAPSSTAAPAVVPSSRRRPRKTNESSNGSSRRTSSSSSSSSSTEEVPQVQAYMALPAAAVKVYDMPVETIVTKTKTQTGKARIRRRLDICQAMTIIRQVLQDTAATADITPPATSQTTDNSSNGHSSSSNCGDSGDGSSHHDTAMAVKCSSNGSSSSSNGTGPTHTNGSSSGSNGTAATGLSSSSSSRRILLRAVVEVASIQPSNGSLAILNQGYSVGSWCSLLSSHGFDVTTIHVKGWKKDMGLLKRDKDSSREVARQLFAQAGAAQGHLLRTKNTHGRAEALLIAAWGLGWSANHASATPSLGPIRATVNMDGGMHVLPSQQQQQGLDRSCQANNSTVRLPPAAAVAAAAAGATSSDDECEGSLLHSSHSVTSSHSGHTSFSVFAQGVPLSSLTWLQHPLWATQGHQHRVLDVSTHMEATAAAAREAAAAKAAAQAAVKEERAAARRAAAEQRAAAKAADKAERAAAAAAKKQEGRSERARSRKGSRAETPDSGDAV